MAFDSTAPAASSTPSSSLPFVSTDRLAQTWRLELVGGSTRRHVDGEGWLLREWGDVVV